MRLSSSSRGTGTSQFPSDVRRCAADTARAHYCLQLSSVRRLFDVCICQCIIACRFAWQSAVSSLCRTYSMPFLPVI